MKTQLVSLIAWPANSVSHSGGPRLQSLGDQNSAPPLGSCVSRESASSHTSETLGAALWDHCVLTEILQVKVQGHSHPSKRQTLVVGATPTAAAASPTAGS